MNEAIQQTIKGNNMNTYFIKLGDKTIGLTMSKDKAYRLKNKLVQCLTVHHYSLEPKDYTNIQGQKESYTMQLWTPSPQWEPSLDDKHMILCFREALPLFIKSSEYSNYLKACELFFERFKTKMIEASKPKENKTELAL